MKRETERAHRFNRTLGATMLSLLLASAAVQGIVAGVSYHDHLDRVEAAEQSAARNDFWSSLAGEGLDGDSVQARLSRALVPLLAEDAFPAERASELLPGSLGEVYVPTGEFEGVGEALGRDVFTGIDSSGQVPEDSADRRSRALACEDCGYLDGEFRADVVLASSGDTSGLLDEVPATGEWSLGWVRVAGPASWFGALLVGLVGALGSSRSDSWGRSLRGSKLDPWSDPRRSQRVLPWLLAFPVMAPWAVVNKVSRSRARRAQRRAEKERERAQAKAQAMHPVGDELARARANLARLEQLPDLPEVREARKVAQRTVAELVRTPDQISAIAAVGIAQEVLRDSQALLDRSSSLVAGHEEVGQIGRDGR